MIQLNSEIIVAIDGYSSCGKSSFAKLIAKELNYRYLDSGAMYRVVALFALRNNLVEESKIVESELVPQLDKIEISFELVQGENHTFLNGEDIEREIRGNAVAAIVSEVSKIPEVRKRLVNLQQELGKQKGIVMDGRDIGTVVFPQAEIKLFMTADVDVRAERRFKELQEKGIPASLEEIRQNISERDYNDIHRKVSPLIQAPDALVLDNSQMTFAEQLNWFKEVLINKGFTK